jgi:hypothetical protein
MIAIEFSVPSSEHSEPGVALEAGAGVPNFELGDKHKRIWLLNFELGIKKPQHDCH